MLSTPKSGWVEISLGDWNDRASYLTDVHLDILDSLIALLKKRKSIAVYCDAEGWEYYIIFEWFNSYVITLEEDATLKIIDREIIDIAKEVYKDISNSIDAWANWDLYVDEKTLKKNKAKINRKLKILDSLIKTYEKKERKSV